MCNRLVDMWCWSSIESTLALFSNLFQLLDRTCFKTFDIFKFVSYDPNWNWKLNCPKLLVVVLALIKVGPLLIVFHQGMQNLCKTVNISFGLYSTRTRIEQDKRFSPRIRCFLKNLQSEVADHWAELFFHLYDIWSRMMVGKFHKIFRTPSPPRPVFSPSLRYINGQMT